MGAWPCTIDSVISEGMLILVFTLVSRARLPGLRHGQTPQGGRDPIKVTRATTGSTGGGKEASRGG